MIRKVVMPAAGQTTDVATVTKINVSVGDSVKKGDILLEVETDKAVLPIESFAKGFVTEIFVNEFDKVDAGSPLLSIGDKDDLDKAASSARENAPEKVVEKVDEKDDEEDDFRPVMPEKKVEAPAVPPVVQAAPSAPSSVKAMPNAKKLAAESGIDLEKITPSNGQFVKISDVMLAINEKAPVAKESGETIPTARMRNTLARRLDEASKIPTFSLTVKVDPNAADLLCASCEGVGRVHLLMLALAKLADRYPLLRVRFEGGVQKLTDRAVIGFGVSAENGTVSASVGDSLALGIKRTALECEKCAEEIGKGDLSCVGNASLTVFDVTKYGLESLSAPIMIPETSSFGLAGDGLAMTVTGTFDARVFECETAASVMADLRGLLTHPALMLL